MSNPNQLKSEPKDTRYSDTGAAYSQTYRSLLWDGIYFFDDHGKVSGRSGKTLLEKMLAHYEKENERRSAYLLELLDDYKIVFKKNIESPDNNISVLNFSVTDDGSPKSPEESDWEMQQLRLRVF